MSTNTRLLDHSRLQGGKARIPRQRRQRAIRLSNGADSEGLLCGYDLGEITRPSSELDESRRRVKRNVQEIEGQLRLGARRSDAVCTETILTEMTRRLQAMATYQRTILRSGQFDEVDLATYLKQASTFLCRSHGRSPEPGTPSSGGWCLSDAGKTLSWSRSFLSDTEPITSGLDLGDALRFFPPRWQEQARRAICACAVMFPPGIFTWRSLPTATSDIAGNPKMRQGDLGIRLSPEADHLRIELWVADRSLGLPQHGELEEMDALARQIAGRLLSQTLEAHPAASDPTIFEVTFVCTDSDQDRAAMMQMATCLPMAR